MHNTRCLLCESQGRVILLSDWLLCEWISVMSYMPLKVQTHCPSFSIFVAKLIEPIAEMTASVRLTEVSSTWLRPTAAILLSWDVLSNGEKSSSPDSQLITATQATLQLKVRGASMQSCVSLVFHKFLRSFGYDCYGYDYLYKLILSSSKAKQWAKI